jgi:hypothetical protein
MSETPRPPKCPHCGFTVLTNRYPRCERCERELPSNLVLTKVELESVFARERVARERASQEAYRKGRTERTTSPVATNSCAGEVAFGALLHLLLS